MSSFIETEIGTYPDSWDVDRVDSVFGIQQGKQVSKKNRIGDNQRPFLRTKNVFWNRLDLEVLDQMHFTEAEEIRLAMREGDLLLCEGGDIGRAAMWRGEIARCYHQNHLHRLRALDGRIDPQYGVYWFWYSFNVAKLYFGRGNVTTIPNLSRSKLAELPMAIPPLPEQKKIAHILSTVQRAIEAQERIIATTTELKKALMQKLFTEGLRGEPQKETEIGLVPESWEVVELGELISIAQYGLSVKSNPDGNYPILRMTNQIDGQIVAENLKYVEISESDFQKFRVERGDILFNRTNSFELVGRTAIFDIDCDFVFASYLIRLRTNAEKLNPYFLNCYFNTDETQARLKTIATRAVSQSNISATRLKGVAIRLPSVVEQSEIVSKAVALDRKIALHRRKKMSLQDLFRTLLHELMTAAIRVDRIKLGITNETHTSQS
ncbi:MAG: restriction endonuclease subunit S [Desulfobacterales bacterium]|nr:restriction endonuclease subunit S [Desulfobacterales bacterium]